MYQTSYYLHDSGNYYVTLVGRGQTIVIFPKAFTHITGVDQKVVVGCQNFGEKVIRSLGFLI